MQPCFPCRFTPEWLASQALCAGLVFRSIPVTRSIWRWLVLVASSVVIVVCRCGFKTFNPVSLVNEGVKVTSCLVLTEAVKQPGLTSHHAALRVGEFEVATSGGIWVAIRVAKQPFGINPLNFPIQTRSTRITKTPNMTTLQAQT